jgi:hypothetical protein
MGVRRANYLVVPSIAHTHLVNFSTTVSLIALVVSVLSALASILSARYARQVSAGVRDQNAGA